MKIRATLTAILMAVPSIASAHEGGLSDIEMLQILRADGYRASLGETPYSRSIYLEVENNESTKYTIGLSDCRRDNVCKVLGFRHERKGRIPSWSTLNEWNESWAGFTRAVKTEDDDGNEIHALLAYLRFDHLDAEGFRNALQRWHNKIDDYEDHLDN